MKEQFDKSVMELIKTFAEIIEKDEELNKLNFALFYKDGQVSYLDLNAFSETAKRVKEELEGKQEE